MYDDYNDYDDHVDMHDDYFMMTVITMWACMITMIGTKHMTDTLKDVLTLQLIEDGQIELKMESFQPDLLLIGALSSFQ
jgi:hypothetical protein